MSDVLRFPIDRRLQHGEYAADYFGNCPKCRRAPSAILNIHKAHFCVCEHCRVSWSIGENLFSSWREETEADWQRNAAYLARCREVSPLCLPHGRPSANAGPRLPAHVNTFEAVCRYFDEQSSDPPDDAA